MDRINDNIGPEDRSILAQAPGFRLETAFPRRRMKRARRRSRRAVGLGIKTREMVPDDFVGCIAFDALRAGIPAYDISVRIQHEDRIVRHAADELPELPLAFAQGLQRNAALRDVARHLGKTDEAAGIIADRIHHDGGPEAAAILAYAPSLGFIAALARS